MNVSTYNDVYIYITSNFSNIYNIYLNVFTASIDYVIMCDGTTVLIGINNLTRFQPN